MFKDESLFQSEDETDPELYLDAIGVEENINKIVGETEMDNEDIPEFESTLCVWNNYLSPDFPFARGVYTQLLEARVLLNDGRKCDAFWKHVGRISDTPKVRETVLTCQVANRINQKQLCSICGQDSRGCRDCRCGSLKYKSELLASSTKGRCNSYNLHICKQPPSKCVVRNTREHSKASVENNISALNSPHYNMKNLLVPKKSSRKQNTQRKTGSINHGVSTKCNCRSPEDKSKASIQIHNEPLFSSANLQLISTARSNNLTTMVRHKQDVRTESQCICAGSNKKHNIEDKCKNCRKSSPRCICNPYNNILKPEKPLSIIVIPEEITNEKMRCTCGFNKRIEEIGKEILTGTIERISFDKEEHRISPKSLDVKKTRPSQKITSSHDVLKKEELKLISLESHRLVSNPATSKKLKSDETIEPYSKHKTKDVVALKTLEILKSIQEHPNTESAIFEYERLMHTVEEEFIQSDKYLADCINSEPQFEKENQVIRTNLNSQDLNQERREVISNTSTTVKKPDKKLTPREVQNLIAKLATMEKNTEISVTQRSITKPAKTESEKGKQSIISDTQQLVSKSLKMEERTEILVGGTEKTTIPQKNFVKPSTIEKKENKQAKVFEPQNPSTNLMVEKKEFKADYRNVELKPAERFEPIKITPIHKQLTNAEPIKKPENQTVYKINEDGDENKMAIIEPVPEEAEQQKMTLDLVHNYKNDNFIETSFIHNEKSITQMVEGDIAIERTAEEIKITIEISEQNEVSEMNNSTEKKSFFKKSEEILSSIRMAVKEERPLVNADMPKPKHFLQNGRKNELSLGYDVDLDFLNAEKREEEELGAKENENLLIHNGVEQDTPLEQIGDKNDICNIHTCKEKSQKTRARTSVSCRKSSKIPRSTSQILPRVSKTGKLQVWQCCNAAINTEMKNTMDRGEQWQVEEVGKVIPFRNCKQITTNNEKRAIAVSTESGKSKTRTSTDNFEKEKNNQFRTVKCENKKCPKLASDVISGEMSRDQLDSQISKNCSTCIKRPSSACKYDERKKMETFSMMCKKTPRRLSLSSFENTNASAVQSSKVGITKRMNYTTMEQYTPIQNSLEKSELKRKGIFSNSERSRSKPRGKICRCHTANNTDPQNLVNKYQQCHKRTLQSSSSKYKKSQTGGTFEQDMIASYVASCTAHPENTPPQQFVIQTLLYQFAGNELNKDSNLQGRQKSLEKESNHSNEDSSKNFKHNFSMRSIQVQVGPSCPPKCEAAQTLTTFVLCNPQTVSGDNFPLTTQGNINYICGPNIPGIRTRIAMNLNQLSMNEENSCCNSPPEKMSQEKLPKPFEGCASSDCFFLKNENANGSEDDEHQECSLKKPHWKASKKDKYVILTVTPVQTESYEPNYFIILTSPNDQVITSKNVNEVKRGLNCTNEENEKEDENIFVESPASRNINQKVRQPLSNSKKQILSIETLKSREILDLIVRQPDLMKNASLIKSPYAAPIDLACSAAGRDSKLLELQSEVNSKTFENTGCGPDACIYFTPFGALFPKDESVECSFEKDRTQTETVACGSQSCIHQKHTIEEIREERYTCLRTDTRSALENCEKIKKETKNTRCGPDICCFQIRISESFIPVNQLSLSIQTDGPFEGKPQIQKSAKVLMANIMCDACCNTEIEDEKEQLEESEYCESDKCTHVCEKGEDNKPCIEKALCETDTCINACEIGEFPDEKCIEGKENKQSCQTSCTSLICDENKEFVNVIEETNQSCDPLCQTYTTEINEEDNDKAFSFCDSDVCDFQGDDNDIHYLSCDVCNIIDDKKRAESLEYAECDDSRCPEKNVGMKEQYNLNNSSEDIDQKEKRENVQYPKNNVKTKLDKNDLFALELAMRKFIKTKPESAIEEQ